MTELLIAIIVVLVIGFGATLWVLLRRTHTSDPHSEHGFVLLQNQLNELTRTVGDRLDKQFGESSRIIQNVTERLTKLDETNKQVLNFSEQLQRMQDILKNPKHRGVFGEYSLEMLLKNAFSPTQYQMQYSFKDGAVVDAVIFLDDQCVPIDSKFSLENYSRILDETDEERLKELETVFQKDLKNRINETAKYIRPEEGTTDFALMFIPAEGLYYELLVNETGVPTNRRNLLDYASREKKVHIVSPTTFYAFLQSLWHTMRDRQIQESTKEILKNVQHLHRHIKEYETYMKKHGNHLSTAVNSYNAAYKELAKIEKDVVRISGGERSIDPMHLDKPKDPDEVG